MQTAVTGVKKIALLLPIPEGGGRHRGRSPSPSPAQRAAKFEAALSPRMAQSFFGVVPVVQTFASPLVVSLDDDDAALGMDSVELAQGLEKAARRARFHPYPELAQNCVSVVQAGWRKAAQPKGGADQAVKINNKVRKRNHVGRSGHVRFSRAIMRSMHKMG